MLRNPLRVALLACPLTLFTAHARAGALYNATALTATNDAQPIVEGLDNNGRVLFWNTSAPPDAPLYSLYNSQDGTITPFVDNNVASQKTQFTPQYMSGNGQMIGWLGGQPVLSSGGQTTVLPGWGHAVNDSGQVVVSFNDFVPNSARASIVSNGVETPLGVVPGYDSTAAAAINNAGQVAGTANLHLNGGGDYLAQPFFFDGQHLVPLGTFGGSYGYAVGINNRGDVIGAAWDGSNRTIGFVSHQGGPLVPLTVQGNSVAWVQPTSINDSGQIVGRLLNGNPTAFLYQNGVVTDLNKLLSPSAHLTVTDAYFINNAGQIVAKGILDGVRWPQLFLLTPDDQPVPPSPETLIQMAPEPSALAVFGLMFAGVFTRRRWRRPG